jgi:DNA-3-methyladenine glycosylase
MKRLSKAFFAQDAVVVAKMLLGKALSFNGCSVMIIEAEAYKDDEASHGFIRTPRSAIMHDTYGCVYIYFIYGTSFCLNFTTNKDAVGAVLIRAVEPLDDKTLRLMQQRRKNKDIKNLCNGPGKLCQALGITKEQNGTIINDKNDPKGIKVYEHKAFNTKDINVSKRIGITKATHLQWRFFVNASSHISSLKNSSATKE